AERAGDHFRLYIVKSLEGRARSMTGDPGRGRTLLEEAGVIAERLGTKFVLSWQRTFLARSLLDLGDHGAVPAVCEEAIRLAEEAGDKWTKAVAHRKLAEALICVDPLNPENAEHAIKEAIRILEEIGAKPELARSYVSYARLLKARGAH